TYIARMDADDISLPTRFIEQVRFLQNNADVVVCGTNIYRMSKSGEVSGLSRFYREHEDIKAALIFKSPLAHPTVMIRGDILRKHSLFYTAGLEGAEDYDLWLRLI